MFENMEELTSSVEYQQTVAPDSHGCGELEDLDMRNTRQALARTMSPNPCSDQSSTDPMPRVLQALYTRHSVLASGIYQ